MNKLWKTSQPTLSQCLASRCPVRAGLSAPSRSQTRTSQNVCDQAIRRQIVNLLSEINNCQLPAEWWVLFQDPQNIHSIYHIWIFVHRTEKCLVVGLICLIHTHLCVSEYIWSSGKWSKWKPSAIEPPFSVVTKWFKALNFLQSDMWWPSIESAKYSFHLKGAFPINSYPGWIKILASYPS